MPTVGKLLWLLVLAAPLALSGQSGSSPGQATPPPVELPFDRVKPEAVIDATAVRGLASANDAVWMLSADGSVVRVDPATNAPGQPVAVGGTPCPWIELGLDAVWVPLCGDGSLARIDPASANVTRTPVPGLSSAGGAIAVGVGSVWLLADDKGALLRIDPDGGLPVADAYLPDGTSALAFGAGALWAAVPPANLVLRINPYTNLVEERIAVSQEPMALTVGEGAVWVVAAGNGSVVRIDPKTNRVVATIDAGAAGAGSAIAAGEGGVWVRASGLPLLRIDARVNRVTHKLSGAGVGPIVVAHRALWLAVSESSVWRVDPRFVAALR